MEMIHHAINWFEIPVLDFNRAKRFYSAIYDFEMPEMMMGENQMGFFLHNRDGGGIGGAIVKGKGYIPSHEGAKIYLGAGSGLITILSRVPAAGGKVILQETEVAPGMGRIAMIEDTEGNTVFLHSQN